jgi:XTP/dITP diphosphohydrolase
MIILAEKRSMETLVFATNNAHKLEEVKQILEGYFNVIGMTEAGFNDDIPENEPTLEGNARVKAKYMANQLKSHVFADDTGLEIEALNGEPGVISARYAGAGKKAEDNIQLVLEKLKGESDRKAQFRTVICLIFNEKEYLFEGIVKGTILTQKHGSSGFGYDPIFQPEGFTDSFAEMDMMVKNKISHRGLAIQKMVDFLKNRIA